MKIRGGLTVEMLRDFAFFDNQSYSLKHLRTFTKDEPLRPHVSLGQTIMDFIASLMIEKKPPKQRKGKEIDIKKDIINLGMIDFVKNDEDEEMKNEEEKKLYTEIIIIFQGKIDYDFAHAACFVRQDNNNLKQLLLLDCKNSAPIYYPKLTEVQKLNEFESVEVKRDIQGEHYYQWNIFCIKKRFKEDENERKLLHNRMLQVPTGEESYSKARMAVGLTLMIE